MVFGRSLEGVAFVTEHLKRPEVILVDENLRMGTVKRVDELNRHEELSDLLPLSLSVERSKYIIYGPRLHGAVNVNDILSHVKAIAQNMKQGQHFINLVPLPLGRSAQLIEVLEAASGLKVGKDFGYHYFPILSKRQNRASVWEGKREPWMAQAADTLKAEEGHIIDVMGTLVERFRDVWIARRQIFISEYIKGSLILDFVNEEFSRLQVYQGLSTLLLKSINEFMTSVVERVREAIKAQGIRPAKGVVGVVWDANELDMLGEEERAKQVLIRRLLDEFKKVEPIRQSEAENMILNAQVQKGTALLFCTREGFESLKGKGPAEALVPAVPLFA